MVRASMGVALYAGPPERVPAHAIEVDLGVSLPVAYSGLRRLLAQLRDLAPKELGALAQRHPAEWNHLFPGSVSGAPTLSDLALTPSERRLHRESEQTFWVLNLAAEAILEAIRATGRPLLLRHAGACDLVSLRGLMRACEWARVQSLEGQIVLADWDARAPHRARVFEERRNAYLGTLRDRMRAPLHGTATPVVRPAIAEVPVDLEGRYLLTTVDDASPLPERIAAAVLAIRACFFSTNYEGALLAAEQGLALLDRAGASLDSVAVAQAWDGLDEKGFITPAIEVDRSSLGDSDELRALFWRQIGVVHVFTGLHEPALDAFQRGLDCKLSPERHAQLRMFRALTLIKRLGNLPQARAEIEAGLAGLAGRGSDFSSLHEGWLRNVYALTYFQEKALEPAMLQEKKALKCVGELHDPSATHLKINLISNVSVLQEAGKRLPEAISTWRRFEKISASWGENFTKHHRYRLAGLQLLNGERDAAVEGYGEAYRSAETLGDAFHRQAIASELGRLHLDGGARGEAEQWFDRAVEGAKLIGDPLKLAESLAGQTLAQGSTAFAEAERCCGETTTHVPQSKKLAAAIGGGDATAIQAALPPPRTKLNRPFDLVNL